MKPTQHCPFRPDSHCFCWLRATLCVLLAGVAGHAQSSPQPTPTTQAVPEPAAEASAMGLLYKFEAGQRTTYQVRYESAAHADFRALFAGQGGQAQAQASTLEYTLNASLRGHWVETVLSADAQRVRAFYQLRQGVVNVTVNGQEQAAQAASAQATLSDGVLVEMDPEGKIFSVSVPSAADKFSRDLSLSLLGITEFVLPAVGGSSSWQTREQDRTGEYGARYTLRAASSAGAGSSAQRVIRKTKTRYFIEPAESTLPGQVPAQKRVIPSGTLEARFDSGQGRLLALSGTDIQETVISGKHVAHSSITLRLSQIAASELKTDDLDQLRREAKSLAAGGAQLTLYTRASPREMQSSIQRTQLGSATLDSLLSELTVLENVNPQRDQDLYLKFKALVYLHPEACLRLASILETAAAEKPTFVILARALGAVGSPQAQSALIKAIQARPGELIAVSNLIPTLADAPAPTREAEAIIRQLAASTSDPSIAATSLLALGTMAHGLAHSSPERSARIVRELLEQANVRQSSAESENRAHDAIEALGNTRSPAAQTALASFAGNASPRLRAAAMDALRYMPAPRADVLLLHGLGDADPTPRLEAAYALGFRRMSAESFATQKRALKSDDNEKVRAAVLSNLWKSRAKFPEARGLVEAAAGNDPSEYVRKVAQGMLSESP